MRRSFNIVIACLALATALAAQDQNNAGKPAPTADTGATAPRPSGIFGHFPDPAHVPAWDQPRTQPTFHFDTVHIRGYAIFNAFSYDWQTYPEKPAETDIERVVLETHIQLAPWIELDAEFEIEHGGTGSALEFEQLEEFGEFEFEAEHGGEFVIEELALEFFFDPRFNLNFGLLEVPIGYTNNHHLPSEYYTVTRPQAETTLIPAVWREAGIQAWGTLGRAFQYDLMLIASLDSSRFSSERFIADGVDDPFESSLANNLALAGRFAWQPGDGMEVALTGFFGNTGDNRPKDNLAADAYVTVANLYAVYDRRPYTVRASVVHGSLQNSEKVTLANKNLSNNLQVPRTPVAREALGAFVEAGVDVLPWITQEPPAAQSLDLFVNLAWYDTQFKTVGSVLDSSRNRRQAVTAGINGRPWPNIIGKLTSEWRWSGLPQDNRELTYAFGFGVEF